MIQSLVRTALQQRLVVVVVAVVLLAFGFNAARQLSVDAFPDVTNVQVQIATEAPGRSPEEVERFVTVPLEISMTGLPGLEEMRSLNKPGLSLITLVFTDATDVYFARQLVMERLLEVGSRMPEGVVPVLGPVSTGLGEVYQYTLDHPDDGDRQLTEAELTERRIVQDWVVRPLLRSIPGVAEINSQGGYNRQYQVLVNPDRLRHYQLTVRDVYEAVARNNANSGGGVLPQYAEQYLIRGIGLVKSLSDIGAIVLKEVGGTPVYVRDVAEVTFSGAYEDQARIGFALAHLLDPSAPPVADLRDSEQVAAQAMYEQLIAAKRPLVIAGTSAGSLPLLDAADMPAAVQSAGRACRRETRRQPAAFGRADALSEHPYPARQLPADCHGARNGAETAGAVADGAGFRHLRQARGRRRVRHRPARPALRAAGHPRIRLHPAATAQGADPWRAGQQP